MKPEKAIILDNILKRFKGNETIFWSDLKKEFTDNTNGYYILENNIKYLLGEGILEKDEQKCSIRLSDKGFATYTDLDSLGYVAITKKEKFDARIKYSAFFITIATFLILCYNFSKTFTNQTNDIPIKHSTNNDSINNKVLNDTLKKK